MDREIIVKRLGEMTLAMCEMQDVINRQNAEIAALRAQLPKADEGLGSKIDDTHAPQASNHLC